MLDALQHRFEGILRSLKGQGRISESNVEETSREIRRALLEADVNVKVARDFVSRVREKALGEDVLRGLRPDQQFVKIIHDELCDLLGGESEGIRWATGAPTVVMLVGLQGCGKTTTAAKLAAHFRKRGRRPFLVAVDVYRPAAVEQLAVLGQQLKLPVFRPVDGDAVRTAVLGVEQGRAQRADTIILDTAGRLHIDDEMMQELERIKSEVRPGEILFVADAMVGQDAVNAAREFHQRLAFQGVVLTKLDGDTRGGAAMSVRAVTGVPIKFIGLGEKLDALESFHPDRLSQRILGMGDVVGLVEKVQEQVDRLDAEKMAEKMQRAEFDLEDFLSQLQMLKRMGPLDGLLKMIPGVGSKLKELDLDPGHMVRTEAIIQSMTPGERANPGLIKGSRKRRIARGSGTGEQDVGQLLNQYDQMKGMMKQMSGLGGLGGLMGGRGRGVPALAGLPGGPGQPVPRGGQPGRVNPVSAGISGSRAQRKAKAKKKKKKR